MNRPVVIILDTDHMTILKRATGQEYQSLAHRMAASADQDFATTAVTLEEQMRGWLAAIRRSNDIAHQVHGYEQLIELVDFFSRVEIQPLTIAAANQFDALRQQKVRIGTMDLKIASIALAENALLLSANLQDYQRVPALRVEDWLH